MGNCSSEKDDKRSQPVKPAQQKAAPQVCTPGEEVHIQSSSELGEDVHIQSSSELGEDVHIQSSSELGEEVASRPLSLSESLAKKHSALSARQPCALSHLLTVQLLHCGPRPPDFRI